MGNNHRNFPDVSMRKVRSLDNYSAPAVVNRNQTFFFRRIFKGVASRGDLLLSILPVKDSSRIASGDESYVTPFRRNHLLSQSMLCNEYTLSSFGTCGREGDGQVGLILFAPSLISSPSNSPHHLAHKAPSQPALLRGHPTGISD